MTELLTSVLILLDVGLCGEGDSCEVNFQSSVTRIRGSISVEQGPLVEVLEPTSGTLSVSAAVCVVCQENGLSCCLVPWPKESCVLHLLGTTAKTPGAKFNPSGLSAFVEPQLLVPRYSVLLELDGEQGFQKQREKLNLLGVHWACLSELSPDWFKYWFFFAFPFLFWMPLLTVEMRVHCI